LYHVLSVKLEDGRKIDELFLLGLDLRRKVWRLELQNLVLCELESKERVLQVFYRATLCVFEEKKVIGHGKQAKFRTIRVQIFH
jgi:hypothetical protein